MFRLLTDSLFTGKIRERMITTTACKHCAGPIECDVTEMNKATACPHCGETTFIAAPMKNLGVAGYSKTTRQSKGASNTAVWVSVGAVCVLVGIVSFPVACVLAIIALLAAILIKVSGK